MEFYCSSKVNSNKEIGKIGKQFSKNIDKI